MHALEETKQWITEGRHSPRHVEPWGAFLQLWANLGRYHPEYDHNDRARFWDAFMSGFNGTTTPIEARLTLTGRNGARDPRTVIYGDKEIGRVHCVVHMGGGNPADITWEAVGNDGISHGDRYISDWAAAKQLALGLRLGVA